MFHLIIMRHAKSSWSNPGQSDFDRTLSDRGRSDLPYLAEFIKQEGLKPELVMCSPAVRTRATYDGIKDSLPPHKLEMMEEFYHGSADKYYVHLKHAQVKGDIMIIGHNPSCELLANMLYSSGARHCVEAIAWKYPTGAISVIRFDLEKWADIEPKSGYLSNFAIPRELRQAKHWKDGR